MRDLADRGFVVLTSTFANRTDNEDFWRLATESARNASVLIVDLEEQVIYLHDLDWNLASSPTRGAFGASTRHHLSTKALYRFRPSKWRTIALA